MKKILSILLLASSLACSAQWSYDAEGPKMLLPTLEREASPDYDLDNRDTYPVYRARHTIAPEEERSTARSFAIWCTKDATYLAERVLSTNSYMLYYPNVTGYIQDADTGIKYRQTDELGYPTHIGRYLIHGLPHAFIVNIEVYPPLPQTCTQINYGNDACQDPRFPDSAKERVREKGLKITDLQKNQELMKYNPPTIVE